MKRCVQPELLDRLPPGDPRSQRSRRELSLVNAWMGNARFLACALLPRWPAAEPLGVADLGSGDGRNLLATLARLPPAPGANQLVLLDRQPVVGADTLARLRSRGWRPMVVADDLEGFLEREDCGGGEVALANLFLHHFEDVVLRRLFGRIARRWSLVVACEPRRSTFSRLGARCLGFAGCGPVTRHDARVSVEAGFLDGELSRLWPAAGGWSLEEKAVGLFSHRFIARRLPGTRG